MPNKVVLLLLLLTVALTPKGRAEPIKVASFSTLLTEISREVGGMNAEVFGLVKPDVDPHEYEPTPADLQRAGESRLIVTSGKHMGNYLNKVRDATGKKADLIQVGDAMPSLKMKPAEGEPHGPLDADGMIEDPHWWHSVENMRRATAIVRDAFVKADPEHETDFRENASALYRQLRERGYPGGSRQTHRWVQAQRATPAGTTPPCRRDLSPILGQADASPLASPRQLAWLLLQPVAKLDATQKAMVAQIEQDREVRKAGTLARCFTALVQDSGVTHRRAPGARLATLKRWLSRAKTCDVQALQSFAAGVQQDRAAIEAALTTGWSNGQTEGHVNKLKLLKRQMYGRAKFDLLRRRLLLAS